MRSARSLVHQSEKKPPPITLTVVTDIQGKGKKKAVLPQSSSPLDRNPPSSALPLSPRALPCPVFPITSPPLLAPGRRWGTLWCLEGLTLVPYAGRVQGRLMYRCGRGNHTVNDGSGRDDMDVSEIRTFWHSTFPTGSPLPSFLELFFFIKKPPLNRFM